MTKETDAAGGETPVSAPTAEKVEIQAPETIELTEKVKEGEDGKPPAEGEAKPEAAKTEAEEAAQATEAAKTLAHRKQSAAERIAEITRARRDAERRAEAAEKKAADLLGKLKQLNPAEFDDPAELTAARVEQTLDRREADRLKDQADEAREQAKTAKLESFQAKAAEAREKYTDFDDVVIKPRELPMSQDTQSLILEMEESAEVIYALAKNPDEAKRIDRLSEREKAFELGKIAMRVTQPPPRRVTQAPSPVETVSGKASGGASFDPNKASVDDYIAKRKAGWAG